MHLVASHTSPKFRIPPAEGAVCEKSWGKGVKAPVGWIPTAPRRLPDGTLPSRLEKLRVKAK